MFKKFAAPLVAAGLALSVAPAVVPHADAAPAKPTAVARKVTARSMPTKAMITAAPGGVASLRSYSESPQESPIVCPLGVDTADMTAGADWTGKRRGVAGQFAARNMGTVAKAKVEMARVAKKQKVCVSAKYYNAKAVPSVMRLSIRTTDQEIGTVWKVTEGGKVHYEYAGFIRVGSRVESVSMRVPSRFKGDVSKFAYMMSLAGKQLRK